MPENAKQVENVTSVYLDTYNQWSEARKRAEECYNFVLNKQWNDEEIAVFLKQGSPPMVYNLILPRLFNLIGTEKMNRRSIRVRPFYSSQRELASILSGLWNHVWSTQDGEYELSKVFADGLIMPLPGCLRISIEPDEVGFMDYRFEALPPYSVLLDPNHRRYDLRDCDFILREAWLRPEQIMDAYGEFPELKQSLNKKHWWERLSEELTSAIQSMFGVSSPDSVFYDKERGLYKTIEMQNRIDVTRETFIDPNSGEYILLTPEDAQKAAESGMAYVGPTRTKKIHYTTICPYHNLLLLDEDSWLETSLYDIVAYYSIDLNNAKHENSSLVDVMLDPQKNLNKREIQKTSYIDRSMIAPMVFSYDDRDTKEDYDAHGNSPSYSMLVRNLKFPPHRISPSQMTADVWNDIADTKEKLNDISGINDTARGQSEFSNESARLYQMKSQRVGATINHYLNNLSLVRLQVARYFLDTCRQVYPELNRIVSTMDAKKDTQTAVLNQQVGDEIRNQVSSFLGQVVLDEGEFSATKLQENLDRKMALATMMPPEFVNWAWILKDSELPDVEEQIEYIKMVTGQMQQQQARQQAMQEDQIFHQQNMDKAQLQAQERQAQEKSKPKEKK